MRLIVAVLVLAVIAIAQGQFVCQHTIDVYNQNVNVGQFEQAASLTFDPNVVVGF